MAEVADRVVAPRRRALPNPARAVWTSARAVGVGTVAPILAPWLFLVAGAAIAYPFSLDPPVARERLLGLVADGLLAMCAAVWLRRGVRPAPVLIAASAAALAGGVWVIAASGPEVFRGTVGALLDVVFRPVFGRAEVTDSIAVGNTRFIVGYNGLADLCLVAIFCCGAVMLERPRSLFWAGALAAIVGLSVVLLVGTGARGGLTGLAAGVCAICLFAWPRRYALAALLAAPAAIAVAALAVLDKGLEFSSTAGRLTYWADLARLVVEYPLTGVGLGVDTPYQVALQYEINPDPERVFYAHNTFVQTYLEQGPLGALGMLLVPVLAIAAALIARRRGVAPGRRMLLVAGLGLVGGLEAHGLTDQVVTTTVGTAMLLVAFAAVVVALDAGGLRALARCTGSLTVLAVVICALGAVAFMATPGGRAQAALNLGGLELNQALAMEPQDPARRSALADAERTLGLALGQDPEHPGVLRELAFVRSARFDDPGAVDALAAATRSPRLDAFDMLQIAHVYRNLGFADDAYAWAARAFVLWDRAPEDAVMQVYAQSTLHDDRARTLAEQAEAAMRARHFADAESLFQQALTFEPSNAYLHDRVGAAERAVAKYGP